MKKSNQKAQSSENKNESLESSISRRKFLTAAAAAPLMMSPLLQNLALAQSNMPGLDAAGKINLKGKVMLLPFDYKNVKLGSSRWQQPRTSSMMTLGFSWLGSTLTTSERDRRDRPEPKQTNTSSPITSMPEVSMAVSARLCSGWVRLWPVSFSLRARKLFAGRKLLCAGSWPLGGDR